MVEQLFLWQAGENKDGVESDHFNSGKAADTLMASARYWNGFQEQIRTVREILPSRLLEEHYGL